MFDKLAALIDIWQGTGSGGSNTCNVVGACTVCDSLIVVSNIVTLLLQIAIPLSVIMIIWGGFLLMTAGGSEEKVRKGKDAMLNAVIGLAIALAAWAIINTVLSALTGTPSYPWSQLTCS